MVLEVTRQILHTHSSHTGKLSIDPEVDRTFHVLRRSVKQFMTEETPSSRSTEPPPGFNLISNMAANS